MLNYNHRLRCKQAPRELQSAHVSVCCVQTGSGDNVCIVASRTLILREDEHQREQAKPHQGQNKV